MFLVNHERKRHMKGEKEKCNRDIEYSEIVMKEEKLEKKYDYRYQNPVLKKLKKMSSSFLNFSENGLNKFFKFFSFILNMILFLGMKVLKILMGINGIFIGYFAWKVFWVGGDRYLRSVDIFAKVVITEIIFFLILMVLKLGKGILWKETEE